jgi:hypothetical protein
MGNFAVKAGSPLWGSVCMKTSSPSLGVGRKISQGESSPKRTAFDLTIEGRA